MPNQKKKTRAPGRHADGRKRRAAQRFPQLPPEEVCALVDPFCGAAKGARLPTMGATRTVPIQVRTVSTLSTDLNGNAALHFRPAVLEGAINSITLAGTASNPTIGSYGVGTDVTGFSDLNAEFAEYRVVSVGVRVTYIGAPLTATGYLHHQYTAVTPDTGVPLSNTYAEYTYTSPAKGDVALVGRVFDSVDRSQFHAMNDTEYQAFGALVLSVIGGEASQPLLRIELVQNLECTPKALTVAARIAAESRSQNTVLLSLADATSNKTDFGGDYRLFSSPDGNPVLSAAKEAISSGGKFLAKELASAGRAYLTGGLK